MTEEVEEAQVDTILDAVQQDIDFSAGKPEDFPDDFWDQEKNAPNTAKLFDEYKRADKIAKDLRVKLGKGEFTGKAPQDISEYALDIPDEHKDFFPDDDPIMLAAKEAAKEAGLPVDTFKAFMNGVLPKMVESAMEANKEPPPPSEEEIAQARSAELAKLGPSGQAMARAANEFVDELVATGLLSNELKDAYRSMVTNADQLRVMNTLRSMAQRNRENVNVNVPLDEKASRSDLEKKLVQAAKDRDVATYNKISQQLASYN